MIWQGFDISDLEAQVIAIVDGIELDARQILEDLATEAVDEMYAILLAARTATGDYREASGKGVAGRVNTGQMARDIKAALETGMDGSAVLTWGWIDNLEDYYIYQEQGTGRIGAMSALQGSFTKTREKFFERLRDIGLEVS
jgi:hypothetical protein